MHISSRANLLHSTFGRTQSLSGRGRVYLPLSILLAVLVCLLASNATAGGFTATYDLGSLDVADFSIPPHQFFTGPFNYGYTPVGLDGSVNGPLTLRAFRYPQMRPLTFHWSCRTETSLHLTGKYMSGLRPSAILLGK